MGDNAGWCDSFVACVRFDLYIVLISVLAFNYCITKELRVAKTNGATRQKQVDYDSVLVSFTGMMQGQKQHIYLDCDCMVMGDETKGSGTAVAITGHDPSHVGDVLALTYIHNGQVTNVCALCNIRVHDVGNRGIFCPRDHHLDPSHSFQLPSRSPFGRLSSVRLSFKKLGSDQHSSKLPTPGRILGSMRENTPICAGRTDPLLGRKH